MQKMLENKSLISGRLHTYTQSNYTFSNVQKTQFFRTKKEKRKMAIILATFHQKK